MNFSGKITRLLISTVGFSLTSSAYLLKTQVSVFPSAIIQLAQVLTPEEINLRAKQTIVRIDGASVGSGSIIEYSDQVYTVLTNWHVMKNSGEYTVQTIDGRKHQVDLNSIERLPGLDLAILKFTSTQNYQTSETGDSANLNEGQSVYFAGYPGELRREDNRYYRFFTANLVGILPKSTENGYSLIYNGEAFPGMSGGPVFNQQGLMIGVHGEANVHALSGGTSNYAIPINSYKGAIAQLNTPTSTATPNEGDSKPDAVAQTPEDSSSQSEDTPNTAKPAEEDSKPDAVAETPEESSSQSEDTPNTAKPAEVDPKPEIQSEDNIQSSSEISSVPTFSSEPNSITNTETQDSPQTDSTPVEAQPEPEASEEVNPESVEAKRKEEVVELNPKTETEESKTKPVVEADSTESSTSKAPEKTTLISSQTGIDYTKLKNLLTAKKWSEADVHTYKLVEQIVKTAKQQNKHSFIELKTIANFSCPDIRTIDSLWQEYSGNKFGFSSQQEIWQTVNQKGDFSTQTWRQFATKVGWKKGEVANSKGYLLYDELDFDPKAAPSGHLPWWFALPEEEQNVIKQLFARCNFNPSSEELATEAEPNKVSRDSNKNPNSQSEADNQQPNLDKSPKQ